MVGIKYRLHGWEVKLAFLTGTTPVWTRRCALPVLQCIFLNCRKECCLLQSTKILLSVVKWTITNINAVSLWMVSVQLCTFFNHSGANTKVFKYGTCYTGSFRLTSAHRGLQTGLAPRGSWQRKRRDGQEGTEERMQGMKSEISPAGLYRDNMCSEFCQEAAVASGHICVHASERRTCDWLTST